MRIPECNISRLQSRLVMRFLCAGLLGAAHFITMAAPAFAQTTATISATGTSALPLQSDVAVSGMSPDATGLAFDWGWVNAGGQVEYDLAVAQAGTYQLILEAASPYSSTGVTISVNGTAVGSVNFANTGSYAQYQNAAPLNLTLSSGTETLVVTASTAGFNLGGIRFVPAPTVAASGTSVVPLQNDVAVAGMSPDANGLAFDWGWMNAGGQVQYNLSVAQAGNYQLILSGASPNNGSGVTVSVNGTTIGTVDFANTGSYAQYQNATPLSVPLFGGIDTLSVTANTSGFNIGGISLSPEPVNGMCGAANGTTLPSAPASSLCSAGSASSTTGTGPWSWSCLGSNGGATASCSAAASMPSLSPVTLSLPTVYPTNTLQINSTLSASTAAAASTVQTIIQDQNGNTVIMSSQNLAALAANTTLPVSFTYTVPTNATLPPGTYKVSQGFVTSGNFTSNSSATFVVPAATATLNENFNDGRTTYNPNKIWVDYYNWNNIINNESEAYVPDTISIVPGTGLQIRADQRYFAGQPYTSGVITSLNGFSQTYGHFEMRAKLPGGVGTWPAFWLLPIDSTVFGPVSTVAGEADIMEHWGFQPTNIYQTLHTGGGVTRGCGKGSNGIASGTSGTLDWTQAYHVFALDWKPGVMTWLIDGVACNTQTTNIPNGPMYILANLAIGSASSWGGAPNAATPFPSYYDINYVKVWQYPNMPAQVVPQERFLPGASVIPAAPAAGQTITINGQIASGTTNLGSTSVGAIIFNYWGTSVECYGSQLQYFNMLANTTAQYSIPCTLPANLPDGIYVIYIYSQPVSTASTAIPAFYYVQFVVGNPLPPLPN